MNCKSTQYFELAFLVTHCNYVTKGRIQKTQTTINKEHTANILQVLNESTNTVQY